MVKPSPQLQARMRFTTKQVGKGFYRGTRTGSMGAHTPYGGYIIDYRKTRHYVVPDFKGFKLTPFVSMEVKDHGRVREDRKTGEAYEISGTSGMEFLKEWKEHNPREYEDEVAWERSPDRSDQETIPEEWKFKLPVSRYETRSTPPAHTAVSEISEQGPVSEMSKTGDNTGSVPLR
ncbi:uncharacterized protein A1O9_05515 [Exophiala aquamarina CBS 119918]|uniref:50S ribosomal protein YmL27 n=1 Tax=Exophiala aquamarina CBS 119918 TaxID=1182545 RepID=A0A072PCT9_9EURO|nr:uncharacterized protein A1O9_05515 [Exophiala aquamarina CBS 119918]KEF57597.1 hypothetical protein A1O9_05515 [Exophiala aquamarina CBS 119918]